MTEATRTLEFGKVLPMLAETAAAPFDSPEWVFEVKWDGYRALAFLERDTGSSPGPGSSGAAGGGGRTRLQSRRLRDLTPAYPDLAGLHRHLDARRAVVDGEIVALKDGRSDFQTLQAGGGSVVYVAFDLLELDGDLLLARPLEERKGLLADCLGAGPDLVHSGTVRGDGVVFYRAAVERGLEGVVGKRLAGLYHPGRRTREWLKVRNVHRAFAVVCGYTRATDARPFGALVLGVVHPADRLVYAGHVGTGFDEREMARLVSLLGPPAPCPLWPAEPRELRGRTTWVRPERVVEVEYLEWTRDGRLRHPVYRGLRLDKGAADCPTPARASPAPEPGTPDPPGPAPPQP